MMIGAESRPAFPLQPQLDALARGECSEDEFLDDFSVRQESDWDLLAVIDQRYRRGGLQAEVFHSIEAKIARRALKDVEYGRTIDLHDDEQVAGQVAARDSTPSVIADVAPASPPAGAPRNITEMCGQTLAGRYVLESILGSGGMAVVFKALDLQRGESSTGDRNVAIKILHPKATAAARGDELRREFQSLQILAHPNLVKVYEMGRDGDLEFFTMELLRGELLSAALRRTSLVPREYAWAIIREVGAGLDHAHSRGLLHGDFKPQNVMLTSEGRLRILDFGASAVAPWQRSAIGAVVPLDQSASVTPAYASCEQLKGWQADRRDDLFALACLSYELLAGQHPFQRKSSIEARELQLQPVRPLGLTSQQWRTLQLGLAWRREDRSLGVREWLSRLGIELAPDRLPQPELSPAPPRRWASGVETAIRKSVASRRVAIVAAPIVILAGLIAYGRVATDPESHGAVATALVVSPPSGTSASPATGAALPNGVPTRAAPTGSVSDKRETKAGAVSATNASIPRIALEPDAHRAQPRAIASSSGKHRSETTKMILIADSIIVLPGRNFAEVKLRLAGRGESNRNFTWWTQDSTAKSGVDFVPQARTAQSFSEGRRATKLFVRILHNPSRSRPAVFHVVVAEQQKDSPAREVARAEISLPAASG